MGFLLFSFCVVVCQKNVSVMLHLVSLAAGMLCRSVMSLRDAAKTNAVVMGSCQQLKGSYSPLSDATKPFHPIVSVLSSTQPERTFNN